MGDTAAGIGLRAPHYSQVLEQHPPLAFLEVHSENFFVAGGVALAWLERFRAAYPLSFHGVGLSLGSTDALSATHLARLQSLVERFEPMLVSEHLCWSSHGGRFANDLLPLPYSEEALAHVCTRVTQVQERLGRQLLVENVSSYLSFPGSIIPEWEFVAEVARRTGCGVLLDVNNIWVSACNHGFDARRYLESIDARSVKEIHLAGHDVEEDGLLVDTHGAAVSEPVWALYAEAINRMGPRPTLVEWDTAIPPLEVLLAQARRAQQVMDGAAELAA